MALSLAGVRLFFVIGASPGRRRSLLKPLSHEIFGVAYWIIVQLADDFISLLLVKRSGLEAERLQRGGRAAFFEGVRFSGFEKSPAVAAALNAFDDPKRFDMKPSAPDVSVQAIDRPPRGRRFDLRPSARSQVSSRIDAYKLHATETLKPAVCTENLNPDIAMMKPAKDGV
jgi:hypothetical protein